MLKILWGTRQYFFRLALISVLCFALERVVPWRRELGLDLRHGVYARGL
ncbi:MAG: hypothetical protein VX910_09550 [Candidatus Latescibacterota bacterium]|nr:hypothetical protein [Candidatus Latescibacterota bacterium]